MEQSTFFWIFSIFLLGVVSGSRFASAATLLSNSTSWNISIPEIQYDTLGELYNGTKGADWSWLDTSTYGPRWNFTHVNGIPLFDPCQPQWQGLSCNCTSLTSCFVTSIFLSAYGLQGELPISFKGISSLLSLDLSDNVGLVGGFPRLSAFPSQLQVLDLSHTAMEGEIPDYLCFLSDLRVLKLRATNIDGRIPSAIGNLQSLEVLDLGLNRLEGIIPLAVCDLVTLQRLSLDFNFLGGQVYPEIGRLVNLQVLHWQGNHLNGTIPDTLKNLTKLTDLNIAYNIMRGRIPEFGTANVLTSVSMGANHFTGHIPVHFLILPGLTSLSLEVNFLNGSLPEFAVNSSLQKMVFDDNIFIGRIPECYYTLMPRLRILSIQNNGITGTISPSLAKLPSLRNVYFGNNYMVGTIPEEIYQMKSIQILSFLYNFYNGTLSNAVGNLTTLRVLDISYNLFTGTVPNVIGNLQNMTRLYLCGNQFHSTIPASIGSMPILRYLLLNDNGFTGTVPSSFMQLKNLGWFYLSENALYGELYPILIEMPKLIDIIMFSNFFTGPLPSNPAWRDLLSLSFGYNFFTGGLQVTQRQVRDLVYVDLSKNLLSCTVPAWAMSAPVLAYFYMNENFIHGTIPPVASTSVELIEFWLDANSLTGSIPVNIGNSTRLQLFRVGYNLLTGTIPASLTSLRFMVTLFLQSNRFTGSVDALFDPNLQKRIKYVDISDNFFSGQIPGRFFNSTTLVSFAATTNCFSGTLPNAICLATSLEDLVLDGASTGTRCQRSIFSDKFLINTFFSSRSSTSGSNRQTEISSSSRSSSSSSTSVSTAFVLTKKLTRGIPPCLFGMPQLQLLHLSGNALTGSLPNDVIVSPSLQNLSIANNQLSGPIPKTIQEKSFFNLDVSYNKFTGTLSADIPTVVNNGSYRALRNRLSGNVPVNLRSALNISILEGNLFSCDFERTDLPTNDPKSVSYSCGSDQTNRSLIIWVVIWPAVLLLFIILDRFFLHVIFIQAKSEESEEGTDGKNAEVMTWLAAWYRFNRLLALINRWRRTLYVPLHVLIEEDEDSQKVRSSLARKLYLEMLQDQGGEEAEEEKKYRDSDQHNDDSDTNNGHNNADKANKYKNNHRQSEVLQQRGRMSSSTFSSTSEANSSHSWQHGHILASVLPPHRLTSASASASILYPSFSNTNQNPALSLFRPTLDSSYYHTNNNNANTSMANSLPSQSPSLSMLPQNNSHSVQKNNTQFNQFNARDSSFSSAFFHRMSSRVFAPFTAPVVQSTTVNTNTTTNTPGTEDYDPEENANKSTNNHSLSSVNSSAIAPSSVTDYSDSVTSNSTTNLNHSRTTQIDTARNTVNMNMNYSFFAAGQNSESSIHSTNVFERIYILSSFHMMKVIYISLTVFILLCLLPLYLFLSIKYSTHTFSYIWRITPMLVSGMTPGYFLFFVFIFLLSAVWYRIEYHKRVVLRSMYEYQLSWPQLSYYVLFSLINLMALLSVNVLYVLTVQNDGSLVLFFSEAGLATFKVVWNEGIVIRGFPLLKDLYFRFILTSSASDTHANDENANWYEGQSLLSRHNSRKNSRNVTSHKSKNSGDKNNSGRSFGGTPMTFQQRSHSTARERLVSTTQRSNQDPLYGRFYDLIVQLTLIITNLLFIPALATAVANANCFYNVFQPPTTVAGGFQLSSCENVVEVGRVVVCLGRTAVYSSITYTAPFLYTYQCSSFLIINYAAVYVYFVLLVTVIVPLGKALWRLWRYEQRKRQLFAQHDAANNNDHSSTSNSNSNSNSIEQDSDNRDVSDTHNPMQSSSMSSLSDYSFTRNNQQTAVNTTATKTKVFIPSTTTNAHATTNVNRSATVSKSKKVESNDTRRSTFVLRPTLLKMFPSFNPQRFRDNNNNNNNSIRHGNDKPFDPENPQNEEDATNDDDDDEDNRDDSDHSSSDNDGSAEKDNDDSIFDKRQLIIRFQSYLALMLIFGVLFPPMAIIICLGATMMMAFEEIMFGHVLYDQQSAQLAQIRTMTTTTTNNSAESNSHNSNADNAHANNTSSLALDEAKRLFWAASYHYRRYLLRENAEALRYLTNPFTLWILLTMVSSIYGYLIFDTMGDSLVASYSSSSSNTAVSSTSDIIATSNQDSDDNNNSSSSKWPIVLTLSILTVLWPTVLFAGTMLRNVYMTRKQLITLSAHRKKRTGSASDANHNDASDSENNNSGSKTVWWCWNVQDVMRQIRRERKVLRQTTKRMWQEEQDKRQQLYQQQQQQEQQLKEENEKREKRGKRQRKKDGNAKRLLFEDERVKKSKSITTTINNTNTSHRNINNSNSNSNNDYEEEDEEEDIAMTSDRESRGLRISEMVTIRRSELTSTTTPTIESHKK